ncbi:MAG: NTP transferase domain-containing protein [Bacteroidia bacterium]|nr:NTP transferase domain-containing protein [Bacteroidia bacterium]
MKVEKNKKVNALILAAGNSTRMNAPKPFLKFDKNITFIEKIISSYQKFGCDDIIIVVNTECVEAIRKFQVDNVTIVINENIELERFHSAKLGFQKMQDCDFCFLQDADNPFITKDILTYVYSENLPDQYIIPSYKGKGGHPILLPESIISDLKKYQKQSANLKEFLSDYKSYKLEIPNKDILININTPEDYNYYFNS